jgi:hypothetical protein
MTGASRPCPIALASKVTEKHSLLMKRRRKEMVLVV